MKTETRLTAQQELFDIKDKKTLEERLDMMIADLECVRVVPAHLFERWHGWSDRVCRSIAAFSDGVIISTNDGYILNHRATNEEFKDANGRIYSQAKNMLRRALKERRVRHRLI